MVCKLVTSVRDMPKLAEVLSAVHKVRLRLRVQAAMQGVVYGLLVGAVLIFAIVVLRRFGVFSAPVLRSIPLMSAGLGLCGLFGGLGFALRRIEPITVAARIDKSHELHDRLASALQFVGVGSTPALDPQKELRELAIADAERVAQGIVPSRAAPFTRPHRLGWLGLALLAVAAAWSLRLPRPASPIEAPKKRPAPVEPRLTIESDLLEPEKEELRELIKQAEQAGDKEALELLKQMQKLLEQVERGEISRKQAFEMLAELERRLAAKANEGALEELKERLRKAGSELGESKLAKDVGQALLKEDLEKAQKELKKLAAEALSKAQKNGKSKEEKDALSKAFDRAAEALRQQNQKPDKDKTDKTDKTDKDKQNERDLDKQKDEWKDKTRSEELTRRMQELKDEERRLKKKLEQNPNDEETERRLKKNQRELEQLEREKQEREEARRELEQLQRDMQRAAEEMRKQLEKMTPEQRKALEKMAEDLQRMQQQMKQMQQRGQGQQQMRSQMTVALGSIKQVLRRIARSGQGQDGQGQGQGQQGQGQGQNGQGQNGQGQNGQGQSMKDYMNRAKGKGSGGESDVLVEGDGSDKDGQKMMILGQGNDPVIIPGLGGGQGNDKGNGQQGLGQGGDKAGNEHDPNMLGNATQIDSKRRLTRVYGKEAAGPTRSETILGAAEKGFATQPYRRVYRDYSAVSEKVMSQQRVPPGYRFYVKRYFQMIKPRE